MRPRDVLAENLKALMAFRQCRFQEITAASGGKLANGTLDRIRRAEVAITVDKLADLAEVFGLEPWQLLVTALNPEALPRLVDARLVEEIREVIGSVPATNPDKTHSPESAHQLKKSSGVLGPALKQSTDVKGLGTNAPRKTGRVQKSGTRRRM